MLYHEDEHPVKRPLTQEEVDFLTTLQKEMNTQDHLATADPRFWVIKDVTRFTGNNLQMYDGYILIANNYYVQEGKDIRECIDNVIKYLIEDKGSKFAEYDLTSADAYDEDTFCEYLSENGFDNPHFEQFVEMPTTSQVFFSQKDAEEYVQKFSYHFRNPYIYCDCAAFNPEMQQLVKILHEADFTLLLDKGDI